MAIRELEAVGLTYAMADLYFAVSHGKGRKNKEGKT